VVLYSPDHDASLASLGREGVRGVVDLWAERTEALLGRPEVRYLLVFENRGAEVGATISHPHGQIYAYPFVPPVPAGEAEVAAEHGCALCSPRRYARRTPWGSLRPGELGSGTLTNPVVPEFAAEALRRA
jgi:hypothetical protein